MTYQKKPQKQTTYPKVLSTFEKKRKQEWLKSNLDAKQGKKEDPSFKARNSKMVQRFSGKLGK